MSKSIIKDYLQRFSAKLLDLLSKQTLKMSFAQKRKFANLLVKLVLPFRFARKEFVTATLMECLHLQRPEAEKLAIKTYETFVLNALEMSGLKYMTSQQILDKIEVHGSEHLDEALAIGKGCILVSGHFSLWEFIPHWLALNGYKMTTVVRRQNNKYVDQWFEEMRRGHGAMTTDSGFGIREILKALKKGYCLGLLMDQDNGKQGIFIKFMEKWASAPTGPAVISIKTGCPLVAMYIFPDYEGKHQLYIYPPIYTDKYSNNLEDQQRLTQEYSTFHEKIIKEHPEQWFWLHRRWKHQPSDSPDNLWVKAGLCD